MNKILLSVSLAALAGAGVAVAQDHAPGTDPMGNKSVTRAEAQAKAEEMFAKMDVNKDGKLDAADRTAMMGQMFDKIDANHDGTISRDEFMAAHQHGPESHEGMAGSSKEAHEMGGHGMGARMEGGMKMMEAADANKDSAITKEEFLAAHLKMFDQADTNHDGILTPAERKAAHGMMRQHRNGKHHGGKQHGDHQMPPPPGA